MTRISPEEVTRRIDVLKEANNFVEAAARLGMERTTLEAWARRNDALIKSRFPHYDYDDYLILTPGQLTARRQSQKKATEAARQANLARRYDTRPSSVKLVAPPESEDAPNPKALEDALMKAIDEAHLMARAWDQNAQLKDQLAQAQAKLRELESDSRYHNLMAQVAILEKDNANLRSELASAHAKLRQAGIGP